MSSDNSGSKAFVSFLNELDANVHLQKSSAERNSLIFGDAESSFKRKVPESFDVQLQEKKRSQSPQRMSDWEFLRLKEEIVSYKMEISQLESRLRNQGEMRVQSEVAAAKEIKRLEMERGADRAELKQMHYLTERLRQSLAEQEEQLQEACRNSEAEKALAESKCNAAQAEVIQLKDFIRQVEEAKDALMQQVNTLKLDSAKVAKELEEEKVKSAKLEFSFRAKARDALYAQKDLETRALNAERKVQDLTKERDFLSESLKEVRSTASWVLKEAELEKELKKAKSEIKLLRDAVQGKYLLEECNNTLHEKINSLEALLKNSASIEVTKNELEFKIREWQALAKTICSAAGITQDGEEFCAGNESELSISAVKNALSMMQMKEIELTSGLLEAQSKIKELQLHSATAESGSNALKEQVKTLSFEKAEAMSLLNVARRKLQLVTQERDTYRQLVDSMEQDMTLSGGMFGGLQKRPAGNAGSMKGGTRVEELERLLEKYQKNAEVLEAELNEERKQRKVLEETNRGISNGKHSDEDLLTKVKGAVAEERARLEKELEIVFKEKEEAGKEVVKLMERINQLEGELEHRALKGDFNPKDTKVLHFKMNPVAVATMKHADELESYRSECERLRERVKVLEEKQQMLKSRPQGSSVSATEDLLPCDDSDNLELTKVVEERLLAQRSKEVQELREQLQQANLRPERLKEAFVIKIKDFRDACYNLFGYKLKLLDQGRCAVSSMYAESPDDRLLFEISPSGNPSLLETPFSSTLEHLISLHLIRQKSFPAFLSAVTLDLFNKQTMA